MLKARSRDCAAQEFPEVRFGQRALRFAALRPIAMHGGIMSTHPQHSRLKVGDPVKLKDSDVDLRGDIWQLRTGAYVIVRWQDDCRSTHCETAIELDPTRARADWSRKMVTEDR
jgi:hypothetical protein